jgi:hypothetical protein
MLGKGSGLDSVKAWLHALGVFASEDETMLILVAVKEFSLRHKRLLTEEEFRTIATDALQGRVGDSGVTDAAAMSSS